MLKRHGWSWQQPARRAIERDYAAVELWRKEPPALALGKGLSPQGHNGAPQVPRRGRCPTRETALWRAGSQSGSHPIQHTIDLRGLSRTARRREPWDAGALRRRFLMSLFPLP
ncbi:winged helix-turn-helix domain-containing protein [Streptomyces sp. NPDC023588]|uniref:helix-turn-helix domain-containing protein n=1 Tax=Streptomyces sp. NPDC023588 TaxID=3154907 RepID=UPI0033DF579B